MGTLRLASDNARCQPRGQGLKMLQNLHNKRIMYLQGHASASAVHLDTRKHLLRNCMLDATSICNTTEHDQDTFEHRRGGCAFAARLQPLIWLVTFR